MEKNDLDEIMKEFQRIKKPDGKQPLHSNHIITEWTNETPGGEEPDGDGSGDASGDVEGAEGAVSEEEKVRMELYDWVQCIVTALVCGILIFIFVGRTIGVDGVSMMDTLKHNDRVLMHNVFYTPKRGDVIVFQSKTEERFHNVPLVKRVIAVAGDTIDFDFTTGEVFINGRVIDEDGYIRTVTTNSEGFKGPLTIPRGFVFVMGDNRNSSSDSRNSDVGLVDTRYILGNVIFLLIPGQTEDSPRDWSRFGVVKNESWTYK